MYINHECVFIPVRLKKKHEEKWKHIIILSGWVIN